MVKEEPFNDLCALIQVYMFSVDTLIEATLNVMQYVPDDDIDIEETTEDLTDTIERSKQLILKLIPKDQIVDFAALVKEEEDGED